MVVGPSPHPQPPGLALFLGRRAGSPSSRAPSPVASPILSRLAPLLSLTDAWEDPVRQVQHSHFAGGILKPRSSALLAQVALLGAAEPGAQL